MNSWKTNPIIALAAIVIIIGAVCVARCRTSRTGGARFGDTRENLMICADQTCLNLFIGKHKASTPGPIQCPRCKKVSAWVAIECLQCAMNGVQTIIPAKQFPLNRNTCPVCGKSEFRPLAYDPTRPPPTGTRPQ